MEQQTFQRNFTSVSPSARWMMLWKGYTDIPYAREVAELLEYPNPYVPDFKRRDYTFWASTLGLEGRYRSIDLLLNELDSPNILELSSGYSFRSLDFARQKGVHYIDTDLPEVIAVKKEFLHKLVKEDSFGGGKLELLPLNALDENAFRKIADHFPLGEVTIVNEGLLGYLNHKEKEQLCSIIHAVLKERGGYWITADIHLRNFATKLGLQYSEEVRKFNEQQQTNENNFESFRQAELFFNSMGFVIDKVAKLKYSELSSFKFMIRSLTLRQLFKVRKGREIQATWRLRAV